MQPTETDATAMLRPRSFRLRRDPHPTLAAILCAASLLLAGCSTVQESAPTSIAFADNENAATLNGITVICESDGVTVHSERAQIENIVLSVDGIHTRVDNIFAFDFVVAGEFDRMTIDADPTIPDDDLPENRIDELWVKAGDNLSSDGPGYGQRMECPTPAIEAARDAEETENYVEHEFDSASPDTAVTAITNPGGDTESVDDELVDDQPVDVEPVDDEQVDGIGDGPQIFGAAGALVLRCGPGGIEVRAEAADLVSVTAFNNATGDIERLVDIGGPTVTLFGDYGEVSAVTTDGKEATFSCAIANRRGNRAPSGS